MATAVILPRQGQSVESCIITKWYKTEGETVKEGDLLYSYETDKAAFDFEAAVAGTLIKILFPEGAEVPVLHTIAYIGNPGERVSDEKKPMNQPAQVVNSEPSPGIKATESLFITATDTTSSNRLRISPRARRMAGQLGVPAQALTGTGPNGRIIVRDIASYKTETGSSNAGMASIAQSGNAYEDKKLSNIRKLTARAMHASLQNSAQLTHHMSADVRNLLEFRRQIKNQIDVSGSGSNITLNDMICFAAIRALKKFPEVNSHFLGESIRTFRHVNLGMAVDTERGLMVPAIRNADGMDLLQLSAQLKSVAEACRTGSIDPEIIQPLAASFTISNLGHYGVEMFTPVINLPQVAILGVCTIISRPADIGNNVFGFIPYMGLSLTYDHRAIDGGPATRFLAAIKDEIEHFAFQKE